MIEIYTDGATSNNGYNNAYGGWAFIAVQNDSIIQMGKGFVENTTNNQCELIAIINACYYAQKINEPAIIFSDSAYCVNCYKQKWYKNWINNGWLNSKKEPVANKGLWEKLIPFFEDSNYSFEKVKGHSTNKYNNMVDKMAVEAKECLI